MLKVVLASLGITIDQAAVDDIMKNGVAAIQAVKDMKASQDRCEDMLRNLLARNMPGIDPVQMEQVIPSKIGSHAQTFQDGRDHEAHRVQSSAASQHKTIGQVQS